MHDTTPAINLHAQVSQPVSAPAPPPQPQIDVVALQMQLIQLQNQMNELKSQKEVKKEVQPNLKINILQPTPSPNIGLQLLQNEVVLIRSPCASPRVSPKKR
jgi:hypothetical protein